MILMARKCYVAKCFKRVNKLRAFKKIEKMGTQFFGLPKLMFIDWQNKSKNIFFNCIKTQIVFGQRSFDMDALTQQALVQEFSSTPNSPEILSSK
jgi:hypothetical protein